MTEKDLDSFAKHHNVWLYSPGFEAVLWPSCQQAKVMCVGWRGNLIENFLDKSYEEINKEWIERYPKETKQAKGIYEYLKVMTPGDVIFVKKGQRALIGWGIVTSDPFFFGPEDEEWTNFRRVKWQWSGRVELEGGKGKSFPQKTLSLLTGSEAYYEVLKKAFAHNRGGVEAYLLEDDKTWGLGDQLFKEIEKAPNQTLRKLKEDLQDKSGKIKNYEAFDKALKGEKVELGEDFGKLFNGFIYATNKVVAMLDCVSINVEKKVLYNDVVETNSGIDKIASRIKFEMSNSIKFGYWDPALLLRFSDELIKQMDSIKDFRFDSAKAAEAFSGEFKDASEKSEEFFDPSHDKDYETETQGIVRMRRGQQTYRERQMKVWDGACAVTGITNEDLLRASHAIPWAECKSGKQRLDPHNGLLLSVALDSLFDKDLICFEDDGRIRISSKLDPNELKKLGVTLTMRLREVHPENLPYLQAQRNRFKEKENA